MWEICREGFVGEGFLSSVWVFRGFVFDCVGLRLELDGVDWVGLLSFTRSV